MIQFYFLSILFNAVSGYVLGIEQKEDSVADSFGAGGSLETGLRFSFRNDTFRLILGVLTMVTGLLKLLSSTQGDVPVVGDLVPALVGFGAGFTLLFEFYNNRSTLNSEKTEKLAWFLDHNKKWVGFIALATAALHFLFPSVLFL